MIRLRDALELLTRTKGQRSVSDDREDEENLEPFGSNTEIEEV